ncbi:MAG TPA: CBS domain-containing protein [Candidatus Polarisedimenticolia bacterium]|nr:CBS domain-containing protein [Candidatus Polarisedimenticolia bacterium]
MRIKEIMSTPAVTCRAGEPLDAAARLMWECDCGVIPVVDEAGQLAGIVTDRDIAMAAWMKGRTLKEIPIAEAMARQVVTCRPDDSIEDAERLMSGQQIRRLPVVDGEGHPVGVLSLGDIARCTALKGDGGDQDVVRSLAEITKPRRPDQAARAGASTTAPRDRGVREQAGRRAAGPSM